MTDTDERWARVIRNDLDAALAYICNDNNSWNSLTTPDWFVRLAAASDRTSDEAELPVDVAGLIAEIDRYADPRFGAPLQPNTLQRWKNTLTRLARERDEPELIEGLGEIVGRLRKRMGGYVEGVRVSKPDYDALDAADAIVCLTGERDEALRHRDQMQDNIAYIQEKGRSGCACRFDVDDETIVSWCNAHKDARDAAHARGGAEERQMCVDTCEILVLAAERMFRDGDEQGHIRAGAYRKAAVAIQARGDG